MIQYFSGKKVHFEKYCAKQTFFVLIPWVILWPLRLIWELMLFKQSVCKTHLSCPGAESKSYAVISASKRLTTLWNASFKIFHFIRKSTFRAQIGGINQAILYSVVSPREVKSPCNCLTLVGTRAVQSENTRPPLRRSALICGSSVSSSIKPNWWRSLSLHWWLLLVGRDVCAELH